MREKMGWKLEFGKRRERKGHRLVEGKQKRKERKRKGRKEGRKEGGREQRKEKQVI